MQRLHRIVGAVESKLYPCRTQKIATPKHPPSHSLSSQQCSSVTHSYLVFRKYLRVGWAGAYANDRLSWRVSSFKFIFKLTQSNTRPWNTCAGYVFVILMCSKFSQRFDGLESYRRFLIELCCKPFSPVRTLARLHIKWLVEGPSVMSVLATLRK